MPYETEATTTATNESGWQAEWSDWWQGYWSDAPAERAAATEPPPLGFPWRESAHEFDFGGEQ